MRLVESLIGGLISMALTRSLVLAACITVILYLAWENGRYGYIARIDRQIKDQHEREDDHEAEEEA